MKFTHLFGFILMAFTAFGFAADVTGDWTGEMKTPDGDAFVITFKFKQNGMKLTGTVVGPQGEPAEISDGKADGDKLSFTVKFHDMVFKHEGTISGDEIKLTMKAEQGDFPGGAMTLKRSK